MTDPLQVITVRKSTLYGLVLLVLGLFMVVTWKAALWHQELRQEIALAIRCQEDRTHLLEQLQRMGR